WRETGAKEKVLGAIMERASSLSEETLRHALADPDGFTPVSLMTAERHRALEQLEEKVSTAPSAGRTPIATGNLPQWDAQPKTYQAATIAHGHLLEWRQVWRADGYSLGDLLYSLPLAPGQKRQIVVADWDRRESGLRTESRTVAESFSADLSRDRDVAEIVNSTVTESIRAGSSTRTWGGGGGLGLGIPFSGGFFGLGVAGGGGGSDSNAWENSARSLSASAGQSIFDRTQQAATAVRSQRATVVSGRQQSESVSVTAEVVANYNHCHSMTVEYFEVLKHYRIDLELASVQECLFIPLQMTRFDDMKALRWRDPLSRYLRDRDLTGGFDAVERILTGYVDSSFPLGRYADEPVTELWGEFRVELDIRRPRDPRENEDINDYLNSNWNTWNVLFGPGAAARAYDESIRDRALANKIFADELAPKIARAFGDTLQFELWVDFNGSPVYIPVGADFTMVSDYRPGREHLIAFRCILPATQQFSRARIKGVRISTTLGEITPGSRSILRYIHVSYRNRYSSYALLSPRRLRDEIKAGDAVFVATFAMSKAEELNPRKEDLRLRDRLLKHLNEHVEHYHQVIWWLMDPGRRFMLLDGFIAPDSDGRSVASVTENQLISIVGNSLVMPVAPGYVLDPIAKNQDDPEKPIDLKKAYLPAIPFAPRRISVPTRGVHAEAILGECNSCEILDNKRFWDWASEPIEEEPTPIQETSTETRRQAPLDTELTPFSAPIVGIQNVPDAPAPTSFADFTKLLGQKDLFKDVTGLELNQANALGAFQRAMQTANFFGKMAASGAKASMANRQSENVMKKVNEAVKSGDMSKEDAKIVVGKLFGLINGGNGESDKPLTGESAVKDALGKVVKGSGELSVSKNTGDSSQTVDAKFGDKGAGRSAIDVQIEGVPAVDQVKSQGCWAAAITMLVSAQRKQSLGIEAVLAEAGPPYPEKYETNAGIKPSEIAALKEAFHLRDASMGALTPEALAKRLSERGPLWIAVDADPSEKFSAHARVITGVKGDSVRFIDPDGGVPGKEEFSVLVRQLDELSKGVRSAFGGYAPLILSV
ncbi:MAG TPA: papain-like cysteine protease family protein, partial [Pyrinomonadaceae bacterium]|nr:papain-like cysteine protease family protein [Pyrinomonadaceae bacterium]